MNIGNITEISGLSAHTIRYYESRGLIHPDRASNGYRIYSEDELYRIIFIQKAKEGGFTLKQIGGLIHKVMDEELSFSSISDTLQEQIENIEAKIAQMNSYKNMLLNMQKSCMKKGSILQSLKEHNNVEIAG